MADRIFRSRSPRMVGAGKRRATEWFPSANVTNSQALATSSFLFDQSLTAAELAKRPFTVTRTVGSIWVRADSEVLGKEPFGAIGFMVVSDKAVATGVTALPDPITQEGSDEWFVYQAIAANGSAGEGAPYYEYKFDSRAMRKVQDGEDIIVMVANASSVDAMQFVIKFRLLIKVT